jgi:hypothetical protein
VLHHSFLSCANARARARLAQTGLEEQKHHNLVERDILLQGHILATRQESRESAVHDSPALRCSHSLPMVHESARCVLGQLAVFGQVEVHHTLEAAACASLPMVHESALEVWGQLAVLGQVEVHHTLEAAACIEGQAAPHHTWSGQ